MTHEQDKANLILRAGLRNLLSDVGVESNPFVSDGWIIDKLREYAVLEYNKRDNSFGRNFEDFLKSVEEIFTDLDIKLPDANENIEIYANNLVWFLRINLLPTKSIH